MNYSPEYITQLEPNEIFVFGSNLAGIHGAGAAKLANYQFGAIYGYGQGLVGQSYAIATKDKQLKTLPLSIIGQEIADFIKFAEEHPKLKFLVTAIGCGLAGCDPYDITRLFFIHQIPENVWLPELFHRSWELHNFLNNKLK